MIDLTSLAARQRALTAAQPGPTFGRIPSPIWTRLIAAADLVDLEPPDALIDQQLFYQLAWRTVSLRKPINAAYSARGSARQQRAAMMMRGDFLAGRLSPRRLYVLLDRCAVPPAARPRVRLLDGIAIIPPGGADYGLARAPYPCRPRR